MLTNQREDLKEAFDRGDIATVDCRVELSMYDHLEFVLRLVQQFERRVEGAACNSQVALLFYHDSDNYLL